jgi:creatinine amidohydrolase
MVILEFESCLKVEIMNTTKARSHRLESANDKLWFDELSMKEAKQSAKATRIVIVPVGSVEEHGDHLPLCTDSLQPEHVALEVAKRTGCLVAPPMRYGVCNSTRGFPGTISIEFESLSRVMRDILQEFIRNGFTRILVLSGHAGQAHMAALRLATQEVVWHHERESPEKRPRIMVCSDYDFAYELKGKYFSEKDGHAGTIETSRVMAIRPDLIKMRGKKSFPKLPRFEIVVDPERYFPSGVMGDPTVASAERGKMINRYVIKEVTKLVEELKR